MRGFGRIALPLALAAASLPARAVTTRAEAQAMIDAVPSPTRTPVVFKSITHTRQKLPSKWWPLPTDVITHPDTITTRQAECLQKQVGFIQTMLAEHPALKRRFLSVEVRADTWTTPPPAKGAHSSLAFEFKDARDVVIVVHARRDGDCSDFSIADMNWLYSSIGIYGYAQCPSCDWDR